MNAAINSILGTLFLLLAFGTVFLMFRLWGYPFDKIKHQSAAPPGLMRLHRFMGVAYLLIYLVLMAQMLPRLWTYQVEFPARTVLHIVCGILIGMVLILKISILRFFRHFEEWMPALGTSLLVLTVVLTSLSIPFAVRAQGDGRTFSIDNLERVKTLLPQAGFGSEVKLETLASARSLNAGRQAMVTQCAICHDLRTVLLRPRPPADWLQTVVRMAEKPNPNGIISELEQQRIVAYLMAITPDLQSSLQTKRQQAAQISSGTGGDPQAVFESTCSQCHPSNLVKSHDFKKDPSNALLERMIVNGLKASKADLETVIAHLDQTFK